MADVDILKDLIRQFMPFAQKHIGFENPPRLFLRNDPENGAKPLGKTAFYDPAKMCVTLYVTDRHPKDILRSLGHELVHHKQNCEGMFDDAGEMGEGYAQTDPHLRQMEIDANRDGSMCLRDFEDNLKKNNTIYFEHLQKGDITMSTKDWKNGEIKTLLSEAWGFKMDLNQLNEGTEDLEEDFAAKHRTAGNTIEEKAEEVEEMCGHDADGRGGEEVVVMGDEEGVVDAGAADPTTRLAALMDELKGLLLQLGGGEEEVAVAVDEPMEEKRMREMVRKAIKEAMK